MAIDMQTAKLNERVIRYMELIDSGEPSDMERAINKLDRLDMTIECLQSTKCGRTVSRLRKDTHVGIQACELVEKWRAMATETTRIYARDEIRGDVDNTAGTQSHENSTSPRSGASVGSSDVNTTTGDRGVERGRKRHRTVVAGANLDPFEAQLAAADRRHSRKGTSSAASNAKNSRTTTNEPPSSNSNVPSGEDVARALQIDAASLAISAKTITGQLATAAAEESTCFDPTKLRSKDRMKVFAGRRKATDADQEVPSLVKLCQRFLHEHIDSVEEVGITPYELLVGIFERCSPEQLERIALKNPAFECDLDNIWERHVHKHFGDKIECTSDDESSWYACYKRLCNERDERLKAISQRISQRSESAATPIRRTMLSEVISPMNMKKRQQRNGVATSASVPDALEMSQARRDIFNKSSKTALRQLTGGQPVRVARAVTSTGGRAGPQKASAAPKRGALMMKSLQMMKQRRR